MRVLWQAVRAMEALLTNLQRVAPKPVQFAPVELDLLADLIECRRAAMKIVDREDVRMEIRIRTILQKLEDAKQ